jgi:hypothetical protein
MPFFKDSSVPKNKQGIDMAYLVRNATSREKNGFFYRKICQNLLVEKYQPQYQVFFIVRHGLYILNVRYCFYKNGNARK